MKSGILLVLFANLLDHSMMIEVLDLIAADQQRAGEVSQPPAREDGIRALALAMKSEFNAQLPIDFAAFLKQSNGLDYNGLVIYGSDQTPENTGPGGFWQGLIAANQEWRSGGCHDYLIIGETELDILTVEYDGTQPARRDRVSGDVIQRYGSVAEMLATLMRERL